MSRPYEQIEIIRISIRKFPKSEKNRLNSKFPCFLTRIRQLKTG